MSTDIDFKPAVTDGAEATNGNGPGTAVATKPKPSKPKPSGKPAAGNKPKPKPQQGQQGSGTPTGNGGEYQLNEKRIAQIKAYEAEVDELIGESENIRSQSASLMVQEIEAGASERAIAKAIGKSDSHVHFAVTAWRLLQDEDRGLENFNAAYKLAKKPAAERDAPTSPVNTDPDASTNPFPKWAAQVRTLNKVLSEMITQSTVPQAKQLDKLLTKGLRDTLTKLQDLEETPGGAS